MNIDLFEMPFTFMNKEYTDRKELVKAFMENWNIGFSVLKRGDLKGFEEETEQIWRIIEHGENRYDVYYVWTKVLYILDSSLGGIPCLPRWPETHMVVCSFDDLAKMFIGKEPVPDIQNKLVLINWAGLARVGMFSLYKPELKYIEQAMKDTHSSSEDLVVEMGMKLLGKKYLPHREEIIDSEDAFRKTIITDLYTNKYDLFFDFYEEEKYAGCFERWGLEIDEERNSNDYASLKQVWEATKAYLKEADESNTNEITVPKLDLSKNLSCFASKEQIIDLLREGNEACESQEETLKKEIEVDVKKKQFLEEVGRVIIDEGNSEHQSIQKYEFWQKVNENLSDKEGKLKKLQDTRTDLGNILTMYESNQLKEVWYSLLVYEKDELLEIILFPTKESNTELHEELLESIKNNNDLIPKALDILLNNTKCMLREGYGITNTEPAHYLDWIEHFFSEIEFMQSSPVFTTVWGELCKLIGRKTVEAFHEDVDRFKETVLKKDFHKDAPQLPKYRYEWIETSNLQKDKDDIALYEKMCKEYEKETEKFIELLEKEQTELHKLYRAVCFDIEDIGNLVNGKKQRLEELNKRYQKYHLDAIRQLVSIEDQYEKICKEVNRLCERAEEIEAKKELQKKKKRSIKRRIKRMIPVIAIALLCILFYKRYMTSTYYGTSLYLGKLFGYKEYTIAENVTKIAPKTFKNVKKMQQIKVPDTVKKIGKEAFAYCESLEKIELPDSVTEVGVGAFKNCISLKEFNFSKNLQQPATNVLENCARLEKVLIPQNITEQIDEGTFLNCSSLNIKEEWSGMLYSSGVNKVPLLENETQLRNAMRNMTFEPENEDLVCIVPTSDKLYNITLGDDQREGDLRTTEFSFDYEEGAIQYHLSGILSQRDSTVFESNLLYKEITDISSEIILDKISEQDSDGNYPNIPRLIDGFLINIDEELDFYLHTEQIQVNQISTPDTTDGYSLYLNAKLLKSLGTFAFSGTLKIDANDSIQFEADEAHFEEFNLLGTYTKNKKEIADLTIDRQYGECFSISLLDSNNLSQYGRGMLWLPDYRNTGRLILWKEGNGHTTFYIWLDWDRDELVFNRWDITYCKTDDKTTEFSDEEMPLVGIWEGTYQNSKKTLTASCKKYLLPIGPDGNQKLESIFCFGPLPGREDYASGIICENVVYDEENQTIAFEGWKWLEHPDDYNFADFTGTVQEDGTVMRGDETYIFEMTKVADE